MTPGACWGYWTRGQRSETRQRGFLRGRHPQTSPADLRDAADTDQGRDQDAQDRDQGRS